MDLLRVFLVYFLVIVSAFGAHLPENFHTCSRSDPNFNECLRSSVEDAIKKLASGNKQLGVIPLDPLHIDLISVGRVPGSRVSIDQKFTNLQLHGLSSSKIDKFLFDFDKCNIYVEATTPVLRSEADFEIKGQLLVFPINGKGPSNVTMTNLKSFHTSPCERFKKKEKEYIRLTNYTITLMPETIHYKFDDLFGGGETGERLSEEVHKTINENAIAVYDEIRPTTQESYAIIFQEIANKVFTKVPLNEIFRE